MRFPLYVFQKVRERVGPKRALSIRVSGSERVPGGFTTQDIIVFLEQAQAYIDFAEVSTEDFRYTFGGTYMTPGQNVPFAEEIKKSGRIDIPIFTIGSVNRPEQAEEIIASGKADGVSMSRALIADPYLPKKAALGRADEIRPCLRCSTCTGSDNLNRHFVCSVNPLLSRESRLGFGDDIGRAKHPKRVLVIGGGPAGITAAVTAAQRGHDVRLVEKTDSVGGWLRFTDTDSLKHDVRRYKEYLTRRLERSGVHVTLGAEASDAFTAGFAPTHIIAATGSRPLVPDFIPGYERAVHATEAYFNPGGIRGERVAIIGGGLIGVETGLHLRNLGKSVTVLEMRDDFATDAMPAYKWGLALKIEELDLRVIVSARVTEIGATGVRYEKNGDEALLEADTILYAVGMKSDDGPYFDLQGKAPFVTLIGDAKRVGKLDGAVHGGFFAAMDIGDI
jgi:NADPH-dependent 2,4-dienoyl-CoA reductase/sulfur reductase-like enzyme